MPEPVDYCNPLSIWQAIIDLLTGSSPNSTTGSPAPVPATIRPPLLKEPEYEIRKTAAGKFQLGKPDFGIMDVAISPGAPFTLVQEFGNESDAVAFKARLPAMTLPAKFEVEIQPDGRATALPVSARADWTTSADALKTSERLKLVLDRIPLTSTLPDGTTVRLSLAKLPKDHMAQFHGGPNPTVFVDPFQASKGVLGLAAEYVHELTHAGFFQRRGFSGTGLPKLLTRDEYVLAVLDEEYAAFKNEAEAIRQFLSTVPPRVKDRFQYWIETVIEEPSVLYVSSSMASTPVATLNRITRQVIGSEYVIDARQGYESLKAGPMSPGAAETAWVGSSEWAAIQATRSLWEEAGAL